jgi:MHS family proline/betaine transporter-like MFS transporter
MGQQTVIDSWRASRRTTLAVSVGTFIAGYDNLLYGYFATVFAVVFFPPGDPTAGLIKTFLIFAVGFAVRPLGGMFFGHIGDRIGRRPALVASILSMALGTLGIGLLPAYASIGLWAPALLLGCRLLQGFSVGGEYVGANVMILEHAEKERSGRRVSANTVAGYLGIAAAGSTSLLLATVLTEEQLMSWGWRLPFFFALPLVGVGLYLRLRIPDSPEFRAAAAKRVRFPLGAALRHGWRGILVYGGWIVMVGLGGYVLHTYMASYLKTVVGMDSAGAFGANLAAVAILAIGAVLGGILVDRYPPWIVGFAAALGVALTVVPGFMIIRHGSVVTAILGQAMWGVCLGVAATLGSTLTKSLFPVEMRYTATAFAHNVTVTLFGTTAPYVSAFLIDRTGNRLAPAWYLVIMACVAMTTAVTALRKAPRGAALAPGLPQGRAEEGAATLSGPVDRRSRGDL